MRPSLRVFLLATCCLFLPRICMADGMMFSPLAAKVDIPDQSAVIAFDGETERLIVSTAFTGPEGEYAWVMPLPATPKVEKVSNGVLPTLRSMCRPRIEDSADQSFYLYLLVPGICLWLAVFMRSLRGGVGSVLLIAVVLPWFILMSTRSGGCEDQSASSGGAVSVEQHIRVGEFEVATVTARSAQELLAWLKENGFKVGPAVAPALEDYIRDGWCFTLYRFSPQSGASRTHPLSFTFPAKAAVYPMRLTGIESEGMSLELFVLGDREAIVPGLERSRCGYIHSYDDRSSRNVAFIIDQARFDSEIPVIHAGVQEVVKPYKVLTALTGKLSPQQMARDYYVAWKPSKPYRPVLYTEWAAAMRANRFGALVFCALTILAVLWVVWRTVGHRFPALLYFLCVAFLSLNIFLMIKLSPLAGEAVSILGNVAMLLAGFLTFTFVGGWSWSLPRSGRDRKSLRAEIVLMIFAILAGVAGSYIFGFSLRSRTANAYVRDQAVSGLYRGIWTDERKNPIVIYDPSFPTEAAAREWLSKRITALNDSGVRNPYTREPLREEDSPGNYQLVLKENGLAVQIYDANGGAQEVGRATVKPAVPAAP